MSRLTYDDLKKRIGKNIKYYNDVDGWRTNRDITEEDIAEYVNEIYLEELFPLYVTRYPHLFRHTGLLNSWIITATVDASSTGSTLIIDTSSAEFSNSMVGLKVFNETDGETAEITAFTNNSTVTLDTTIGDTWDGDTIFVLGQEFALGGDAVDLRSIERVKVQYDDAANARPVVGTVRNKQDFIDTGLEIFDRTYPFVYLTSIQDATAGMTQAIGILPKFDKKISNAIEFDYVARPNPLEADTDLPIIQAAESIIAGGTMKCYEKRQNGSLASYWLNKYERAKRRDISRYRATTSNVPRRVVPSKYTYFMHNRRI